jgi:hypothetical protein
MTDQQQLVATANAIVALAAVAADGSLLKELSAMRDQAVAEQKKLADLQSRAAALAKEKREYEAERDAGRALLQKDRQALEKSRSDLEREHKRHMDRIAMLDRDRATWDARHAQFEQFQSLMQKDDREVEAKKADLDRRLALARQAGS